MGIFLYVTTLNHPNHSFYIENGPETDPLFQKHIIIILLGVQFFFFSFPVRNSLLLPYPHPVHQPWKIKFREFFFYCFLKLSENGLGRWKIERDNFALKSIKHSFLSNHVVIKNRV